MKILPLNKFITNNSLKNKTKNFNLFSPKQMKSLKENNDFAGYLKSLFKVNNGNNQTLPIVSTAIIAYMASTKKIKQEREINKLAESADNNKPNDTEWYEQHSREELKKHGITRKNEQDKYIGSDGKLNTDGNKKINFKGSPENSNNTTSRIEDNNMDSSEHFADIDNSDIDNIPGLHEDLTELNSVGIDMSPELQEIYDAPPIESAQELIEQLLGDLADSVNIDWDFESIIDTMLDEITDIGDWL